MNVTFEDDADFYDICEELDPEVTERIQFDKLMARLADPQSDDEEDEDDK